VLYYGDEIGLTDVEVPAARRRDPATLGIEHGAARDRARTPMPWDGSPGGGFTGPGVTPWLPLGDPPLGTVADQRDDAGSVLALCRDLLALRRTELRRAEPGGGLAEFENLRVDGGQWVYRTGNLVVTANFTDQPAQLPAEGGEVLLRSGPGPADALRPWEGVITRPAR
jgi:alpha-glucosidase